MNDFDKYIRQGEPGQKYRAEVWRSAIGLQEVDGLRISPYLLKTAKKNIEGDITISEAQKLIDGYYKSKKLRFSKEERTEEADKVAAKITEILCDKSFTFSPEYLKMIHRKLFKGIFKSAGKFRKHNIIKNEWVLNGDTVTYAPFDMISSTLNYDFEEEKKVDYPSLDQQTTLDRFCRFISGIWQIHPFGEGNTRTIATFAIKYLRSFGFSLNNDAFEKHSWYFRNALVRANYVNYLKNISSTNVFLKKFFGNLLFQEKNELHNREMHINATNNTITSSPKGKICPLDCTLEETIVLEILKNNPRLTQKNIASRISKSERTVKSIIASLKSKQLIERKNGKRYGYWEIKN